MEPIRLSSYTLPPKAAQVDVTLDHQGSTFRLRRWARNRTLRLESGATHFGFVRSGPARLSSPSYQYNYDLSSGMYFSLPAAGQVDGRPSQAEAGQNNDNHDGGIVISQCQHRGLFQLGGPIEATGRLRYIDGCSDTLLLSPVVRGDACLNLLVLPAHTDQTPHTHPSFRIGVVVDGAGDCRLEDSVQPLVPGTIFVLRADSTHSFHTSSQSLTIVAFHPDSDFGPWHDDHPMINRTIINGQSAADRAVAQERRL